MTARTSSLARSITASSLQHNSVGRLEPQQHGQGSAHLSDLPEAHAFVEIPRVVVPLPAQAQRRQLLLASSGNRFAEQTQTDTAAPPSPHHAHGKLRRSGVHKPISRVALGQQTNPRGPHAPPTVQGYDAKVPGARPTHHVVRQVGLGQNLCNAAAGPIRSPEGCIGEHRGEKINIGGLSTTNCDSHATIVTGGGTLVMPWTLAGKVPGTAPGCGHNICGADRLVDVSLAADGELPDLLKEGKLMSTLATGILRGVTGAYMLQAGYGKRNMPREAAEGLQQFAATGVPQVKNLSPDTFGKVVSASEMGLGAVLLTPFINNRLAGIGLASFSTAVLSIYFRNDDMTQRDGIRPSEPGTGLSKDIFLAAIAGALITGRRKKK